MPYLPKFQITPRLLSLISTASDLRAQIRHSSIRLSALPALSRDAIVRAAHSSTAIEGNTLSLHQVKELQAGREVTAEKKSKQEVKSYLQALKTAAGFRSAGQMKETKLKALHRVLMKGLLEKKMLGCYKQKPNRIVSEKGVTVYAPPLPSECPKLMRELFVWQFSEAAKELSPVITSAVLHHRLLSIHPFADGNGRISRLWALTWLFVREFDADHLMALDECYDDDRRKYYEKIQQARDLDGDLTYWLEYSAECVVTALERVISRMREISPRNLKNKVYINEKQKKILDYLRQHGSAKSPDLEKTLGVTRSRVQQIMKPLVLARLVECRGKTRATVYYLQ